MTPDELKKFLVQGHKAQQAVDLWAAPQASRPAGDHIIAEANAEIVRQMIAQQSGVIEQGSPEWRMMRCGKVTASRIADVMAKPRVQGQGMRVNYRWDLVTERWTGVPRRMYQSKIMAEAHEWEPLARAAYAFLSGNKVRQVPFIDHADIPMCGCSPDGLVDPDGGVELKCPDLPAHYDTLLYDKIPGEYLKQIHFSMACTGRRWWDYCSFNADMPEKAKAKIIRITRDSYIIEQMEAEVRQLQLEIDLSLSALKEKFG